MSEERLPKLDENNNNRDTNRHIFSYCPLKHKRPTSHFHQSTQDTEQTPMGRAGAAGLKAELEQFRLLRSSGHHIPHRKVLSVALSITHHYPEQSGSQRHKSCVH